ncbi:hypothetical protein SAMN04488483_3175 [Pseudomonas helmanticensis]|uniref:Uncharacterized protein n=1 Tax=Pseudomonas helmanticensis TaxID=1471381 RepID=A0ACD2U7C1_9PSED|nr:hypothetical protein SAMN04488483_3175 [Pseudomonas helmanticensis]
MTTPVGAAAGCDLLIFFKGKIKGSQPAAAPTGVFSVDVAAVAALFDQAFDFGAAEDVVEYLVHA